MSADSERPHSMLARFGLNKRDQVGAAVVIVAALLGLGIYYVYTGGWTGVLVDIDLAAPKTTRFRIDINTADAAEFLLLPEIGPALAERIVADRTERGPFLSHTDLDRVRGIGPVTLERIRPYLSPISTPSE